VLVEGGRLAAVEDAVTAAAAFGRSGSAGRAAAGAGVEGLVDSSFEAAW
jgi:hypothetical protein